MIKNILTLLSTMDSYNESEAIEIAKGKFSIPKNGKERNEQIKRLLRYVKRNGNK